MTDFPNPPSLPGGPRRYGEPQLDRTTPFDDPGLTQALNRPAALDATTPIWLRFGPGVPAATQAPGTMASPQDRTDARRARRRRRAAISFVSLLTMAAVVAWLARLLHRLP